MRNFLFLTLLFFTFSNIIASETNEIKLPKYNKKINTFSGKFSDNKSFHIIFTRNTKKRKFESFFYLYNGKEIIDFPLVENHMSYKVVSYHINNHIINLILSYKYKERNYIRQVSYDTNLVTVKQSNPSSHKDFLTSIREKEQSVLIYKSHKNFRISHYLGNKEPVNKVLEISRKDAINKFLNEQSVSSIKTDEFIANGSTNTVRLYIEDNKLYFTRDSGKPLNTSLNGLSYNNSNHNITQVLTINLNEKNIQPKFLTIRSNSNTEFKKTTSFLRDNKLYQLSISRNNGVISITDMDDISHQKSYQLDANLSNFIKGNIIFSGIERFLKNASRSKYIPTITANNTKSDKIRIRVDYVDISYSYNYNFWFHQQMMWQMQQDMMNQNIRRSIPSGFGPNYLDEMAFNNATVLKEKRFFELLIDAKGNLLEEQLPETLYKEIDKSYHTDKLNEKNNYKYKSSCFLKESFRFFAYDRKNERFIIQTDNL